MRNIKRSLIAGALMVGTLALSSSIQAATILRLGWTTADSDVDPYPGLFMRPA